VILLSYCRVRHSCRVNPAKSSGLAYLRFDWPRAAFLSFCLFSPRAPARGPLGAAFLRAARLIFFRSCVSSIALVFAIFSFSYSLKSPCRGQFRVLSPGYKKTLRYEELHEKTGKPGECGLFLNPRAQQKERYRPKAFATARTSQSASSPQISRSVPLVSHLLRPLRAE